VTADGGGRIAPARAQASYLPATLVTGIAPMTVPGIDLAGQPRVAAAIARPRTLFRVTATPLARPQDEVAGLFLVQSAPRLADGAVEPGYVVLFVPDSWLRAAAAQTETLEPRIGASVSGNLGGAAAVSRGFEEAGQRFDVLVPLESVAGAATVLPWIILAGGLVLAVLAGALELYAARRARAKAEVDRIFTLSPDLIVVAGFDGYLKRVNPAFESLLGYTEQEALSRPYVEFVHPDDLVATEVEGNRLAEGQTITSFTNRYVCKDGSYRWIEWTATPVLEERLTYAVGRDVTERKRAEDDLRAARAQVTASRARVVAASDEARRMIERNLHDGTQQRLVALALHLRLAESMIPPDLDEARQTIRRVADELNEVIGELQEISRGIHPPVLSEGGLGPALRTLARPSAIPVELDVAAETRLPEPIEVAAYYVVSEALTNTAKHANASQVRVEVAMGSTNLHLSIRDDGVGGADPTRGSGLIGLRDRVEALSGSIEVTSRAGEGTVVVVELPMQVADGRP
jgi:PAS domain S-box-containing protein